MEQIKSLSHFYDLHGKDVTFYDSRKVPLWSGCITNCLGSRPQDYHYVWAKNVQTFNKNGSKRKNSTGVKNRSQVFNIWYYSYGLVPEGVQPEPVVAGVLTQAEVDAKLKEYVTKRITELAYYATVDGKRFPFSFSSIEEWHLDEAFVTIYRELTQ